MDMQAVLYVGHGSRIKSGVEEVIHFIERCKPLIDVPIQEICFLELAKPSIESGIAVCVEKGATHIAVVPILLLTAKHAKEDIPAEIEIGKNKYPNVTFTYGSALGIHTKMIDSLYDRIREQQVAIRNDASVLLVGRGSSDPAVKRDLTKIAQLLKEKYAINQVDVCFLYGAKPSFDEALQKLKQTAKKQVFIIPYLLFTGILMNNIAKKISGQSTSEEQFILCENLGYHKNTQEVLVEQVKGLLEKEPNLN